MTPGRIAAIITCHNLGRTLREALDSVERQTRPAAEIVVVDGASDETYTGHVLARVVRGGTRTIRVEGRGAAAARNRGARATTADYLVWLDADDVLEPGYFEAAAARLDADSGIDFVSCAMRAFGTASYVWSPSRPIFVDAISTGGVPHASTMVRRRLWEQVGGFDEELPSFELLDFWAGVMERGHRGVVLEEPLLRYRIRSGSGYRRSIQAEIYLARLGHLYEKHRAAVERHGLELIEGKEAFLISQQQYWRTLESRRVALEGELAQLKAETDETVRQLETLGSSRVDLGDLRRIRPLSPQWGRDRGTAVDRHYIQRFLETCRADVRGRVLEVRDSEYTQRFGESVTANDVVDVDAANELATVIADLRHADAIPSSSYDCIILTQTLHLIDDMHAALRECERMLSPGGVLLATAPSVIRVDDEAGRDGDFWRLTEASALKLFADVFPIDAFEVTAYGNVMACAAFLYGMSVEELTPAELDHADSDFPLVIAIRAVKPAAGDKAQVSSAAGFAGTAGLKACATSAATILAYHRIASLSPDSHGLCTPPDLFREHMMWLRETFSPMPLEDLVQAAASGRIPERAVAVTLDDGYLDALTTASPILTELGIPATFFVNTDRLDEPYERYWDVLERIFSGEASLPPRLSLTVGNQHLHFPTETAALRAEALTRLNESVWPLDVVAREEMIEKVVSWSGADRRPRDTHRVMTGPELRELAGRPGHSIGAHSSHHLALTTQPFETKRREVFENKAALERLLGRPVHLFSYPYGDFDAETLEFVSAAGFRGAVTVQPGVVSAGTNRLLLPRHEITAHTQRRLPLHMLESFAR